MERVIPMMGVTIISIPVVLFEAIGAVFGVTGTLLAALSAENLFCTFCMYAVSNTALVIAAIRRKAAWLLAMNSAYAAITVVGLVRHWPW